MLHATNGYVLIILWGRMEWTTTNLLLTLVFLRTRYFSANTPWALAKQSDPASQARLDITLYHTLESLRRCALLLLPVMPGKAASLLEHLGVPREEWTAAHSVHTWRRGGEHASIGRSGEGGDTQKLVLFTKRQTKPAA